MAGMRGAITLFLVNGRCVPDTTHPVHLDPCRRGWPQYLVSEEKRSDGFVLAWNIVEN